METIDSFFQSVLKNLAHELSLTANLKVDLNDKEVLHAAVDRIMAVSYTHLDVYKRQALVTPSVGLT